MQTIQTARDSADAVARFAAIIASGSETMRIDVRWDGAGGVEGLFEAEAAIDAAWPRAAGKELVWLTGAAAGRGKLLRLSARGSDGALLADAAFSVG